MHRSNIVIYFIGAIYWSASVITSAAVVPTQVTTTNISKLLINLVQFTYSFNALFSSITFTQAKDVHLLMNDRELEQVFGAEDAVQVDYQLVYIRQHQRPKRFDASELGAENDRLSTPVKRQGGQEDDDLAHYSFQAHGK